MLANNSAGWCSGACGKVQRFVEKRITFKSDLFREREREKAPAMTSDYHESFSKNTFLRVPAGTPPPPLRLVSPLPGGTMALADSGEINREGQRRNEPHVDLVETASNGPCRNTRRPVCLYRWCAKWESGRKTTLFRQVKSGRRITPLAGSGLSFFFFFPFFFLFCPLPPTPLRVIE